MLKMLSRLCASSSTQMRVQHMATRECSSAPHPHPHPRTQEHALTQQQSIRSMRLLSCRASASACSGACAYAAAEHPQHALTQLQSIRTRIRIRIRVLRSMRLRRCAYSVWRRPAAARHRLPLLASVSGCLPASGRRT
jgi:hypothetical protein